MTTSQPPGALSDAELQSALGNILESLASQSGVSKAELDAFVASPGISEAINELKSGDIDSFYFRVLYPRNKLYRAVVARFVGDYPKVQFLVEQYDFIESHFKHWIQAIEGSTCSADKSGTLVTALFWYFTKERPIQWNYEQEYTYHLPKTVFITQDEVLGFFESLEFLYGGRPEKYLQQLTWLAKRQVAQRTKPTTDTSPEST